MKVNLKIIFSKLIISLFFLLNSNYIFSSENRIIFKINNNVFTLLDLELRMEYLDFVGSNSFIDEEIVLEDFISANLFYEYYKKSKIKVDYVKKLEEIYLNILDNNTQNNKKSKYQINKTQILENIKIDFIRKVILENILNSNLSEFNTSKEAIDLLYKFKIKYINFNKSYDNTLKKNIEALNIDNFEDFKNYLKQNNINFFFKEKELNDINKIDNRIRENILSNNNFFIIEKNNKLSVIFIEKSYETFDGIEVNLFSIKSNKELDESFINCKNLQNLDNYPNLVNKEYKLNKLNEELKNNLININDYVKYSSDDELIYIVLCNIKFDKKILDNVNLNKVINSNVEEIENKFIKKYSKIYNLVVTNE